MTDWKARAELHQSMVGKVPSGSENAAHETLALICAELADLVPQEKAMEEWADSIVIKPRERA